MNTALLTIDDFASRNTPALVDYLTEKGIRPILFGWGEMIEKHYDEALYAVKKGFIVGNHSYSHPHFSELTTQQAIEEVDKKYGKTCHNISYNILHNKLDAEECVNDAYLGAWNAIPPARPNPLLTYLCKIVRNLSLKRYEFNTAIKRNSTYDVAMEELESCLSSPETIESEIALKELTHIIENFLDSLSTENRVIFLRRYWFSDTYSDIAARVGMTEKNVSVRLTRIREKLRNYLTEREVLA